MGRLEEDKASMTIPSQEDGKVTRRRRRRLRPRPLRPPRPPLLCVPPILPPPRITATGRAQVLVERYAMTVFKRADDEDRAGRASVGTARTFYVAANLFDVLKQVFVPRERRLPRVVTIVCACACVCAVW